MRQAGAKEKPIRRQTQRQIQRQIQEQPTDLDDVICFSCRKTKSLRSLNQNQVSTRGPV